jgi:hypothetical protein
LCAADEMGQSVSLQRLHSGKGRRTFSQGRERRYAIEFAAGLVRNEEIIKLANRQVERIANLPFSDLRGKNLACWCKLDAPCHCDVLLELANRPTCEEARE